MSSEQARLMAERIARKVGGDRNAQPASNSSSDLSRELAALRNGLSSLQERLIQIEHRVRGGLQAETPAISNVSRVHSPWLEGVNVSHPSQERFGVDEAAVSELVDYFQGEKTCSLEPGGKPCDHCAMCSSRGF